MELLDLATAADRAAEAFLRGTGNGDRVTAAVRAFRSAVELSAMERDEAVVDEFGRDWTARTASIESGWVSAVKRGDEAMRKTAAAIRRELEPFTACAVA